MIKDTISRWKSGIREEKGYFTERRATYEEIET